MSGGWNFAEAFGHGLVHAHGARDDPQEHACSARNFDVPAIGS